MAALDMAGEDTSTSGGLRRRALAMIPVPWSEIVALQLGRLERGDDDGAITGILADSREVGFGDLFVALNTGVDYLDDARARGAATLAPDDQHAALAALATLVRAKSFVQVVAVVGSTGKTTTKDILGALCAAVVPTVYPEASLNNEIGLPLTLCRLQPDTRVLVAELGMRGVGQIAALSAIARPQLVLVTAVGPEHLELVGSVANAVRANAEAIDALPPGGTAVVPAHTPDLEPFLVRDDIVVQPFDPADVKRISDDRWWFRVAGHELELRLPFRQRHLAENTLAALGAYHALGLPLERVQEGIAGIRLSRWRGEELPLAGGGLAINDAYNANPTSMRAALLDLAERADGRRRVAILGEMAELGADAERYHGEIGALLDELGIESVVGVGQLGRLYLRSSGGADMRWVGTVGELEDLLDDIVRAGDVVLVKASRAVGLEGIPEQIANLASTWSES
jgi:UDP-N-acetylmuramoyl-tripeptide--D-alanyl-D-alanine ligase